MSLVQTYRAEIADRQTRQLGLYLVLAFGVHLLGAASLLLWHPRLRNPQTASLTPLEFVYVQPQQKAPPQPPNSPRQSQTNSTAGGSRDLSRPVQTAARPGAAPAPASLAAPPVLPAAPSAVLPKSAAPPVIQPDRPTATLPVAPSPVTSSPIIRPPAPPNSAHLPSNPAPSVSMPPARRPFPSQPPSLAAQLGSPSVSVESGVGAQLTLTGRQQEQALMLCKMTSGAGIWRP